MERTVAEIVQRTGRPAHDVRKEITNTFAGRLTSDFTLYFDDYGAVTVREVLKDPDKFIGESLADPHEPEEYDHNRAKLFRGDNDGRLIITSYAHGGLTYTLEHDFVSLKELVERTPAEEILARLRLAFPTANLAEDEAHRVLEQAQTKAGYAIVGRKRAWADMIKPLQAGRKQYLLLFDRKPERSSSSLPVLFAPYKDAPFTEALQRLDEILCASTATKEPPFRSISGAYAIVKACSTPLLHELMSDAARGKNHLPAPPQTMIVEAETSALLTDIEQHVAYKMKTKMAPVATRLPNVFAATYREVEPVETAHRRCSRKPRDDPTKSARIEALRKRADRNTRRDGRRLLRRVQYGVGDERC